jgi:type IV pilus assembly protein PilM
MASLNSAWGIDIGNRALKAVRLVRKDDGIHVSDVEVIEHEHILSQAGDNRDSLIQSALANFVQHHPSIKGAIAVGVSGQSSFARFIKLPPVEPRRIPEIVRFEAIQQIPFPLDDVEWSYQLFQNDQSPEVEVGIFAMRRDLVNRHIQYFTDARLDVELVQMNPLAVYNAMQHDRRIKGTTMIVDLGAENTDLIIAEGETIWLRSIPIGGNNFTEALVKSFKLKFAKAEELKRNAATSKYGRQILQAMRPVFADLVAEIQRSIGFYSSIHRDSRIARVMALGGTFRLPGLQKYLQQNLQLEVSRIDRLGNSSGIDAKVAAVYSDNLLSCVSAYGLALQAMGDAAINSSLLPQKIRRERMWRDKTKWFGAAAAMFVVGTAVAYGSYYYAHQQDDNDVAANQGKINSTLTEAKRLDGQWNSIADSGGKDRAQIVQFNGLLAGRDVWNPVLRDILSTLPPGPNTPDELKAMMAIPRGKREMIVARDISTRYEPDLGSALAMDDSAFSQLAGGGERSGINRSGPMPAPAAATVTPADKPSRGYLITLHVTTPNANGDDHITKTVVNALRQLGETSDSTVYRIARAVITGVHKVTTSPGGLQGTRPGATFGGAVFQPPFGGNNPYASRFPGAGGMLPPGVVPGGGAAAAPVDPLADPMIPTESMKDDTEATLLIAVWLDPPKREPKAAVAAAGAPSP